MVKEMTSENDFSICVGRQRKQQSIHSATGHKGEDSMIQTGVCSHVLHHVSYITLSHDSVSSHRSHWFVIFAEEEKKLNSTRAALV